MTPRERIALWVLLGLLALTLLITLPLLFGEVAELRRQLELIAGSSLSAAPGWNGQPAALPPAPSNSGQIVGWGAQLQVRVTQATLSADGELATLSLNVRGSGAADPLLNLPSLVCGNAAYPVDGPSLEAARTALLTLITRGEATGELVFYGRPDLSQACTLVLNPQQPAESHIAPQMRLPVPQVAPVAPVEE